MDPTTAPSVLPTIAQLDPVILGIIMAGAAALVQMLKVSIAGTKLDRVPIFVWVTLFCAGLSLLAEWAGFTHNGFRTLFAQVILSAVGSSGSYSWVAGQSLKTFDGTPASTPKATPLSLALGALILAAMMGGCAVSPQERAFQYGVKSVWSPVKTEYVDYVNKDPNLTPAEKDRRVGPANSLTSEMDGLIEERGKEINDAPK